VKKRICPDTQASVVCLPVVDLCLSGDLDLDSMTFIYELDLMPGDTPDVQIYELPT